MVLEILVVIFTLFKKRKITGDKLMLVVYIGTVYSRQSVNMFNYIINAYLIIDL